MTSKTKVRVKNLLILADEGSFLTSVEFKKVVFYTDTKLLRSWLGSEVIYGTSKDHF